MGDAESSVIPKKRKPKAVIEKAANGGHSEDAAHVGLKPKKGWGKRSFLTQVWLPSIFKARKQ